VHPSIQRIVRIALEMMGRSNETIAEYLFVVESATSPEQYELAMRHLTSIDF